MARRVPASRAARSMGQGVLCAALLLVLGAHTAGAGEADIVTARVTCTPDRVCGFTVTVKHADTGWRHYANRFEILGRDGVVLATRVLEHPHVHEQPFTRTLGGVEVPSGTDRVTLRAHDSVHEYGGEVFEVAIEIPDEATPVPKDD